MERTELPTKADLDELREKGIVPYSSFVTLGAMTLMVLVSLALIQNGWERFMSGIRLINSLDLKDQGVNVAGDAFVRLMFIPAGGALVAGLTAGLFQTRFLFRPANLSWAGAKGNRSSRPSIFISLLTSFILGSVVVLGWLFVCYHLAGLVGVLLNNGTKYPVGWASGVTKGLLPVIILVLSLTIFGVWLGSRRLFVHRHKVPRNFGGVRSYDIE